MDLLNSENNKKISSKPLADKIRPTDFGEFMGQEKLIGEGTILRRLIESDKLSSMVLWGPPGSGKTTLAHIIAKKTGSDFVTISAVISGIKDVRSIIEQAKVNLTKGKKTILFIDEIHRFNKIQQDFFLPYVENGTIILIGATTENPSFSVISALLSRCRVFVLEKLEPTHLQKIIENGLNDKNKGLGKKKIICGEGVIDLIINLSDGDARRSLNLLEMTVSSIKENQQGQINITYDTIKEISQRYNLVYDKTGEEHFNHISALHKSMRGSDPDAALYWAARMIESGDDPLYVARRLIRFATEDIGNADPQALVVTVAAKNAYESLGSPEGDLAIYQAVVYLATAPKSNTIYVAEANVKTCIKETGSLAVPFDIRNAPTKLMKELGYGKDYKYDHDYEDTFAPQQYLPNEIKDKSFYTPKEIGFEREIKKRIDWWKKKKEELKDK